MEIIAVVIGLGTGLGIVGLAIWGLKALVDRHVNTKARKWYDRELEKEK